MSISAWFRKRPVADRVLLVVCLVGPVASLLLVLIRLSFFRGPEAVEGRVIVVALQLGSLIIGLRVWSGPAPESVLRRCLVLSVLASVALLLGTAGTPAGLAVVSGAWLAVQGVCLGLAVGLPSVGASSRFRGWTTVVGGVFIAAGPVVAGLFAISDDYLEHSTALSQWSLVVSTSTGAFALWAVWRALNPSHRDVPIWSQVAVPLAVMVAGGAILFFRPRAPILYFLPSSNGYEWPVLLGATTLPLVVLGMVVRDYGIDSQARRLAGLLESQSSPTELEQVLRTTLDDPELRLVLRVADSERFVDTSGRGVPVNGLDPSSRVEVRLNGEVIAVIVWGRTIAKTKPRQTALIGVAKLAIEKAQLQALVLSQMNDIAESRLRMVDATDRARSAVERDLHDGAQQRLAALSLSMRLIADSTSSDDLACFARSSAEELRGALVELQELARGIHPAVLSDAGLAAALESLAERSPYPVIVDATTNRYAPTVELTAYFVIAEALTNTTKHADATQATVSVTRQGNVLRIVVVDDGSGGADPGGGSGLQGLADRVEAVGGRLEVTSPLGSGTAIVVELPLGADDRSEAHP